MQQYSSTLVGHLTASSQEHCQGDVYNRHLSDDATRGLKCHWNDFPFELQIQVISYLTTEELVRITRVRASLPCSAMSTD